MTINIKFETPEISCMADAAENVCPSAGVKLLDSFEHETKIDAGGVKLAITGKNTIIIEVTPGLFDFMISKMHNAYTIGAMLGSIIGGMAKDVRHFVTDVPVIVRDGETITERRASDNPAPQNPKYNV